MGNKKSKKQPTIYDRIENYLFKAFKNTGLEFTDNEIINFKLRIMDSERYFNSNFDYFIFFNNYLFKEQLAVLYENFNNTIEQSTINPEKPINILVDFDDESECISQGISLEFDSLFTIIFEKLEIPTIIYLDMTNTETAFMSDFFKQIIENVELYKFNRKFDCLYFLLPNTDYLCKNENALYYLSNKAFNDDEENENENENLNINKKAYGKEQAKEIKEKLKKNKEKKLKKENPEDMFDIINEFTDAIFLHEDIEKFINCNYPINISNKRLEIMAKIIKPNFTKMFICFNFDMDFNFLFSKNFENLEKIKFILNNSERNVIVINFCYSLNSNNLNYFEEIIIGNISFIIKHICYLYFRVNKIKTFLGLKINLKIKQQDEVDNLNKLSSRNYDYFDNPQMQMSSRRDNKSKREKEKIKNYFYDSQFNNLFEFLTYDLSTIINNYFEFPNISIKEENNYNNDNNDNNYVNKKANINYEDNKNISKYNNNKYNTNNKNININNTNILNTNNNNTNNTNNNNKHNKNKLNKLNTLPSEIIDYNDEINNPYNPNNINNIYNLNNINNLDIYNHNNQKKQKLYKKLNIEFNEISPVTNENIEIVRYIPSDKEGKGEQTVIKLDHNLHSEKLFLLIDNPKKNTKKEIDLIKKRNKEFNNLKNVINNSNMFSVLKDWNILMTLQNMFINDMVSKSYKIEKSNINLSDYLQKIH